MNKLLLVILAIVLISSSAFRMQTRTNEPTEQEFENLIVKRWTECYPTKVQTEFWGTLFRAGLRLAWGLFKRSRTQTDLEESLSCEDVREVCTSQ
jgi:hypothetical protein